MNEGAWRKLIKQLREGQVVPVIGPELLDGPAPGGGLQARVARRLLALYDPDARPELAPWRELHEVVSLLKTRVNLQDLYSDAHDALVEFSSEPIERAPAAIRQLSAITDFRLYVTLTPDDLLARCLRQRIAVNEVVHAPKWGSDDWADLPADWAARRGEVQLLYLFGKASSLPTFAIHDEDLLEFSNNVIAGGSQVPRRFLDEMRRKGLLLIGCNFPDWLGRFLLRVANVDRLAKKDTRTWFVEPQALDSSLSSFLRSYANQTEVVADVAPRDFVAEPPALAGRANIRPNRHPPPRPKCGVARSSSSATTTHRSRALVLVQERLRLGVASRHLSTLKRDRSVGQDRPAYLTAALPFSPLLSEANARERPSSSASGRQSMNRDFVLRSSPTPTIPSVTAAPVLEAHDQIDFGHAPEGAGRPR